MLSNVLNSIFSSLFYLECDCGDDGECNWRDDDTGEKYCTCKQGYGVNNGKCVGKSILPF